MLGLSLSTPVAAAEDGGTTAASPSGAGTATSTATPTADSEFSCRPFCASSTAQP